jgi:peptide/nickel transport system substrate-binding protein
MKIRRAEAALTIGGMILSAAGARAAGAARRKRNPFTIPHTLRFTAAPDDVNTLNPWLSPDSMLAMLSTLTMAYLVRYDARNQPIPELAIEVPSQANGGVGPDGKTITFRLRRGVVWSDGAPFDARDVVFTWKQVMNPANNIGSRSGWDLITRIDTPNPYTAVFRLKEPYAAFLPTFCGSAGANGCILPEHLLRNVPNINDVPYNGNPVGIGPFKYSSWQRQQQIELVANERYWRGKPRLEKIVFKSIPDRNTALTQLMTHEIDMWYPFGGAYYDRIRSIPGISVLRRPGYIYNHFDFNLTRPMFQDRAVREAIRHAIDRRTILEKIGHGIGVLQESVLAPTHPLFDPHIPMAPFSLSKASQLLEGAGWKRGPDGVRAKNGMRLAIDFAAFTGSPDVDSELALIQQWWKQVGIELDVHRYAPQLMFAPYAQGGIINAAKFDMVAFAWQNDSVGDLSNLFDSGQFPPNGQNIVHYRNATVDKALKEFRQTYDHARQKELSWIVQRQIAGDVPTIVLNFREDMYAFNDDLRNFHPNAVTPFDDMMNVDI